MGNDRATGYGGCHTLVDTQKGPQAEARERCQQQCQRHRVRGPRRIVPTEYEPRLREDVRSIGQHQDRGNPEGRRPRRRRGSVRRAGSDREGGTPANEGVPEYRHLYFGAGGSTRLGSGTVVPCARRPGDGALRASRKTMAQKTVFVTR